MGPPGALTPCLATGGGECDTAAICCKPNPPCQARLAPSNPKCSTWKFWFSEKSPHVRAAESKEKLLLKP